MINKVSKKCIFKTQILFLIAPLLSQREALITCCRLLEGHFRKKSEAAEFVTDLLRQLELLLGSEKMG